mmetsp:Transcript_73844/g.211818  ORF Transcript_73844/g.211818 Transcript_73844/m.211818 type:complete len:237 (-) Transcript_73844:1439-2149(-)
MKKDTPACRNLEQASEQRFRAGLATASHTNRAGCAVWCGAGAVYGCPHTGPAPEGSDGDAGLEILGVQDHQGVVVGEGPRVGVFVVLPAVRRHGLELVLEVLEHTFRILVHALCRWETSAGSNLVSCALRHRREEVGPIGAHEHGHSLGGEGHEQGLEQRRVLGAHERAGCPLEGAKGGILHVRRYVTGLLVACSDDEHEAGHGVGIEILDGIGVLERAWIMELVAHRHLGLVEEL